MGSFFFKMFRVQTTFAEVEASLSDARVTLFESQQLVVLGRALGVLLLGLCTVEPAIKSSDVSPELSLTKTPHSSNEFVSV